MNAEGLIDITQLAPGSDEYTEAVVHNAQWRRSHGPKQRISGLHAVEMPAVTVAPSRPAPASPAVKSEEFADTNQEVPVALSPTIPLPTPPTPTELVKLHYSDGEASGFVLEIEVHDVYVSEDAVSLLLSSSARFSPNAGMRFMLTARNETYPVCYLGAVFRFPHRDINGISFVRISPE